MKVFWSWQSDTPGKTGRFLVRDALRDAIEEIKQAPIIEEPTTMESREALHLDHDIQGVTGSPDLARTIFGKIDASEVVVADVTLVGKVVSPTDTTGISARKKLTNSNVAIELGYALRAVGDRKILLVFNEHYGNHENCPSTFLTKAERLFSTWHPMPNRSWFKENARSSRIDSLLR